MKVILIDFVPDRRWLWCWASGLLGLAVLVGAVSKPLWRLYRQQTEAAMAIELVQVRLRGAQEPVRATIDARHYSAAKAASLLQAELNPLLATVEGLEQPGARLSSLSLDLGTASARIEYITDTTTSAAELTARLNAGHDLSPWRLESVSSMVGGGAMQQGVRAVWTVKLGELR